MSSHAQREQLKRDPEGEHFPPAPDAYDVLDLAIIEAARDMYASGFLGVYLNDTQAITDATALIDDVARLLQRGMLLADMNGRADVIAMLDGLQRTAAQIDASPSEFITLPFDAAVDVLASSWGVPASSSAEAAEAYGNLLIPITARVSETVNDAITKAIKRGIKEGWSAGTFEEYASELSGGLLADAHATTLYQTTRTSAYASGRVNESFSEELDDYIVAYAYMAVGDADTRPNHHANDGRMYEKRHPIWRERMPPNGWNCRCGIRLITKDEAIRIGRWDFAAERFIDDEVHPGGAPDKGWASNAATMIYSGALQ